MTENCSGLADVRKVVKHPVQRDQFQKMTVNLTCKVLVLNWRLIYQDHLV